MPTMIDSGLETYLRQIHRAPLLSAEEEDDLARRIRRARELTDAFVDGTCSLQEKEDAEFQAREARERMVSGNLRLVVNIARKYAKRGMSLGDLIEEGNLGLLSAVERFDPDQGNRFSTYAAWWIKQAIKRSLINGVQPIHIPAYMVEMMTKLRRARDQFVEKHNRPPTIQELAEAMEMSERKVNIIRQAVKGFTAPTQVADSETGVQLADMVTDEKTPAPDDAMLDAAQSEMIGQMLSSMDHREATILRLRYGLGGGECLTLKQIGAKIKLTRERVRQIEGEALRKLADILASHVQA